MESRLHRGRHAGPPGDLELGVSPEMGQPVGGQLCGGGRWLQRYIITD